MVEGTFNLEVFDTPKPGGRSHGGCGSCGSGNGERCGNGLEKIYPTTAVRFGYLRYIGEFTHAPDMKFTCGAKVIIQTRRGIEMGEQVSLTCGGCDKSVTRDQMKDWVRSSGEDSFIFDAGRILREATAADLAEYAHIQAGCREKRGFAQRAADQYKLPLRVVDCEHLFGGERILFFFLSEDRIDFRAMVQDLTREYRTRIDMRQVGARDEARLLADYETCGREVCCKVFLKTLRPITMRMAKVQKATLDPSQVSGRCGRLKCCLRYEHVAYEELEKQLPRTGLRIRTNHGEGVIVNRQVLTQLVQIRKDDGSLVTVVAEDITEIGVPAPPPSALPGAEPSGPRRVSGGPRGRGPDRTSTSRPAPGRGRPGEAKPAGGPSRPVDPQKEPQGPAAPAVNSSDAAPPSGSETGGASGPARAAGGRRRNRRRRGGKGGGQGRPGNTGGGDPNPRPPQE